KPPNILLGKYGETFLVDWGLAKRATNQEEEAALAASPSADGSRPGSPLGTPAYMSPEQAAGRWDLVGPASDIHRLGAPHYVLLTGRPPFASEVTEETVSRVKRGEFLRPRQVQKKAPPALEAICLKAMAHRPEDRYPTALALSAELEHWLGDEPVSA